MIRVHDGAVTINVTRLFWGRVTVRTRGQIEVIHAMPYQPQRSWCLQRCCVSNESQSAVNESHCTA